MKQFTKPLVLLASVLAAPVPAKAQDDPLAPDGASVLLLSHHVAATAEFEEWNPGAFLHWSGPPLAVGGRNVELDWVIGAYRNSYGRTSVALLGEVPLWSWTGGEVSALAGLMRYPEDAELNPVHVGDWLPFGALRVRQGVVSAQIIPGDGASNAAVIALGLTFDIDRGS
jgi:hypothetical protein